VCNVVRVKAANPAYSRGFTRSRNWSAEYRWRDKVKPHLIALIGSDSQTEQEVQIPPALEFRGRQVARAMVRADQMEKRSIEIEQYIMRRGGEIAKESPVLAMNEQEFQRWAYCREAARRADESADRLMRPSLTAAKSQPQL
jgi:hypothetical protein